MPQPQYFDEKGRPFRIERLRPADETGATHRVVILGDGGGEIVLGWVRYERERRSYVFRAHGWGRFAYPRDERRLATVEECARYLIVNQRCDRPISDSLAV